MSDATLARMEHGEYVGVREESRRDGVCAKKTDPLQEQHTARLGLPQPEHSARGAQPGGEAAHTHHEAAWGAPGPRGRPETFRS